MGVSTPDSGENSAVQKIKTCWPFRSNVGLIPSSFFYPTLFQILSQHNSCLHLNLVVFAGMLIWWLLL